jgi:hypothetical protein
MQRQRNPRLRRFEQGEEPRDNAQEGGFVELNGGGDVHEAEAEMSKRTKTEHNPRRKFVNGKSSCRRGDRPCLKRRPGSLA